MIYIIKNVFIDSLYAAYFCLNKNKFMVIKVKVSPSMRDIEHKST